MSWVACNLPLLFILGKKVYDYFTGGGKWGSEIKGPDRTVDPNYAPLDNSNCDQTEENIRLIKLMENMKEPVDGEENKLTNN